MLAELERQRRAVRLRVGGEERWIAADDAGLYRDAFGAVPPSGLPEAFVADTERPYRADPGPLRPHARAVHHRRGPRALRRRSVERARRRWSARAPSCAASCAPAGREREWCDTEVLRRLRRASLAVLRKEIEAADQRALAAFLPSWQGVDRHPPAGAGVDRLREVLVPLQGAGAAGRGLGARRAAAPHRRVLAGLDGPAVRERRGRVGRRRARWGATAAAWPSTSARTPRRSARRAVRGAAAEPPSEPEHELVRERLAQSPCFFTDLLAELPLAPEQVQEALWDLVWAGEATNDAFAPLRAPRLTLARAQRSTLERRGGGRAAALRRAAHGRPGAGPGPLVADQLDLPARAPRPAQRRRTLAELLLERYGIVTREQVLAEGVPGGFAALYEALGDLETLGVCRRGYFIEGLGGAQFALPGAVERLRAQRAEEETPPVVLAATDPAQPYGAALPWPKRDDETRRPSRVAGAYVVLAGAEPVLYVERGGRGLTVLVDAATTRACARRSRRWPAFVTARRGMRLSLERVDGEPVVGSAWEALLVELGFRAGPRKLTLSA